MRDLTGKIAVLLATGGFVGKIPPAPGTLGSLLGLPIYFLLSQVHMIVAGGLTLALIAVAVWSSHRAEAALGAGLDPGCIVIDEIAGMVVALFGLPFNLLTVGAGFLLFRTLDILKPFPISFIERRFSGGIGIVCDDLAAAVAANTIIRTLLLLNDIAT